MSTSWDLLCVDCGARAGLFNADNCERTLWAFIDSADLIAEIQGHPGSWGAVVEQPHQWLDAWIPEFVANHRAHQMVPVSQYGDVCQGPNRRLIDGRAP